MRDVDQFTPRLSAYLDGELDAIEQAAVERHLGGCPACSATLEDLRAVVRQARGLEDRPPAKDLWSGVAQRIVPVPAVSRSSVLAWRERRFSFSIPQLAAAGIALLLAAGGAAQWARSNPAPVAGVAPSTSSGPFAVTAGSGPVSLAAFSGSDSAVAQLERALQAGRAQLDTATVRIIEENLQIIDRAIDQARRALEADPANMYLNTHLAQTMRRKVDLLRQATALVGARS